MQRVLLFGIILLSLSGCLQPSTAFTYEDISSPCSIISSGEVRALYDFRAIEETSLVKENEFSFCMYSGQTTKNESNLLSRNQIILMYVPQAESNETIKEYFFFDNQSESSFISERDLGIGDQSFLAIHFVKGTDKVKHMSAVVFRDESAIIATDVGYQLSGVDIENKEKLKELLKIALSRLISPE
jgi:hypothetical protein